MELGAFSISLAVQDIAESRSFYERLGFAVIAGNQDENWLILRNGGTTIGLFRGMFEKSMLTFNPGWSSENEPLGSFTDIRDLQKKLKASGVTFITEADETTTGPANFTLEDPDGNPILFDQHV